MGINDRDYSHDGYGQRPQVRFSMPPITPVVKWLLIINVAVFFLESLFFGLFNRSASQIDYFLLYGSVYPESLATALQVWRLITYQFLHGDTFHLLFNMVGLFFFGPMIERVWGSRRFLFFYLACGAMGGIVYPLLVAAGILHVGILIGASGAVYGTLAAGAILYPHIRVLLFFVVPVPLGIVVILFVVISILNFIRGENAGGEAAHLAGMALGAIYAVWGPYMQKTRTKMAKGRFERNITQQQNFHVEVDRILHKVHSEGIRSLTRKEKAILKEATQREQKGPY